MGRKGRYGTQMTLFEAIVDLVKRRYGQRPIFKGGESSLDNGMVAGR